MGVRHGGADCACARTGQHAFRFNPSASLSPSSTLSPFPRRRTQPQDLPGDLPRRVWRVRRVPGLPQQQVRKVPQGAGRVRGQATGDAVKKGVGGREGRAGCVCVRNPAVNKRRESERAQSISQNLPLTSTARAAQKAARARSLAPVRPGQSKKTAHTHAQHPSKK